MTPKAPLLTVFIKDLPEVTKAAQAQEARIEAQTRRIECLLAEVEQLTRQNELFRMKIAEAEGNHQGAASMALQQANAYANRH